MSNLPLRPDRETVLKEIKDYLNRTYNIAPTDVLGYLHKAETVVEKVVVPVSVFNDVVSPLEAIVKYLKEVKGLRLVEIARLTGRDQRAIGVTYRAAVKKMPEQYGVVKSAYAIPAEVLSDKTLTVSEHVVKTLKDNYNLTYSEVATLIKRDDRTVWTLYHRALERVALVGPQKPTETTERPTILKDVIEHLKENYHLTYHQIATLLRRNDRTIWTLYNRGRNK